MTDDEQYRWCLDCGYILDHLPENRCPECDRAFEPGNPSTRPSSRYLACPLLLALTFANATLGITALLAKPTSSGWGPTKILCRDVFDGTSIIGAFVLGAWVLVFFTVNRRHGDISFKLGVPAAIIHHLFTLLLPSWS